MDNLAESQDVDAQEAAAADTGALNEGDQALLDMMKVNHDLYAEATFAMWLRVPLMESKQKFALAAFLVVTPIVWLLLSGSVPVWGLAIFTAVGALLVGAFAEREVLSFGPDGLKLHKPEDSKVGPGTAANMTQDEGKVNVNGVTYSASKESLDTLTDLLAAS